MMPICRSVTALFFACLLFPLPALSQQVSGTVKFSLLSVEGLVVGPVLKVDDAFGKKHGHEIKAPFSVVVPTSDDVLELMDAAPRNGNTLVKFHFATPERQPIENIQFITMRVDMGDKDKRLKALADVLVGAAFPQVIANHQNPTRDVVRATTIGDYDAIEVIGTYDDAQFGRMLTRIVGILNPNSEQGIVAIANVVSARMDLATPDDFPRTRGGAMLKHFHYLSQ